MRAAGGRGRSAVLLLAAVAIATSACGSTVAGAGSADGSGTPIGPAPSGEDGMSAGSSSQPILPSAGRPDDVSQPAGRPPGGPGPGQGTSSAPAGRPDTAPAGRGVTPTTITIGVSYFENAATANAAIGGQGITTGNERADAEIVIADINRRGGVLGRKLVPLFYVRDAQSAQTVDIQAQAECTFYTQDHAVFTVIQGNAPVDWQTKPCLNAAGVPAIAAHITAFDDDDPRLRLNIDVSAMSQRRTAIATMSAIRRQQWLDPWNAVTGAPGSAPARVGIVGYDLPAVHAALDRVILPGLRNLGRAADPDNVILIEVPGSQADTGASAAALQNAVLKLNSSGVDHVVLVDHAGALTLLFANEAFSQRYFPRYAGASGNAYQALLTGGNIQPDVLRGVVAAGWQPVIDLPFAKREHVTPARQRCVKLMQEHDQTFGDANAEAVALGYCDKLYFLRTALNASAAPTAAAFVAAAERITGFASHRGIDSRFGRGRHNGAVAYYDYLFDAPCGCMTYRGSRQRLEE